MKWKQAKAEQEAREAEERRRIAEQEQQRQWKAQGLCTYCGGKLGGLFTKKCKSCGKEN